MSNSLKSTTTLGSKDTYTAQMGAEYRVIHALALRAGFSAGTSASNEKYPARVAPPPGTLYAVTAGVGANFAHWHAGIAGSYQRASAKIEASDIAKGPTGVKVAAAGTYEANLIVIAASCGYRM